MNTLIKPPCCNGKPEDKQVIKHLAKAQTCAVIKHITLLCDYVYGSLYMDAEDPEGIFIKMIDSNNTQEYIAFCEQWAQYRWSDTGGYYAARIDFDTSSKELVDFIIKYNNKAIAENYISKFKELLFSEVVKALNIEEINFDDWSYAREDDEEDNYEEG